MPADGEGSSGVLMVLEAAGADEAEAGVPVVGKAGHYLFQQLARVGIDREVFRIHNVLSCQPPGNKLLKMPYTEAAIAHCAPNLDATIADMQDRCKRFGRTFTILTLGRIAFKRIMGIDDKHAMMHADFDCYPHWSEKYSAWVIAAPHPSHIMQGNHQKVPILVFAVQRALEIAEHGLIVDIPTYLEDPGPATFAQWVSDFKEAWKADPENTYLSYDIETPYKSGKDEEDVAREDDDDYTILRCSFAYRAGQAVSVPWRAEYMPMLEDIFSIPCTLLGWNLCPTPDQKILTADLRWVPAGELLVGDKLVSFDENVPGGRRNRRFKTGTVITNNRYNHEVFEISLSDGTSVKVTGEHPWLVKQPRGTRRRQWEWTKTNELKIGDRLQRLFKVWEPDKSYDAGWLAGMYDGEGSLGVQKATGTLNLTVSQNEGPLLDSVCDSMTKLGFTFRMSAPSRLKDSRCFAVRVSGKTCDQAALLGTIRPKRLLSKFGPEMLGAVWSYKDHTVVITGIKSLGQQEIVCLSLDTRTYILEGFGAHNSYDSPRVRAQLPIAGKEVDAMLAWHVLNSALPKGLGFVTPFYNRTTMMWKHLAEARPAYYNAADSDYALRNFFGIKADLIKHKQWDVFNDHVVRLNEALGYMSRVGVLLDQTKRKEAEVRVKALLDDVEIKMQASVPERARAKKVYKKTPKDTTGMIEVPGMRKTTQCPSCAALDVKAGHFKSIGKKQLKAGKPENPCVGLKAFKQEVYATLWAKPLDFKVSKVSLLTYQKMFGHKAIISRREAKITFDENALKTLIWKYPEDSLYPLIGRHREYQKLISTYIGVEQEDGRIRGGMQTNRAGRVCTTFSHNPSTLRLASQNPNLQNIPRPGKEGDLQSLIRNFFVATPGHTFLARDFSGIEAVLVGYEAKSARYIRLAKMDVHSFYTAYALNQLDGRISANDLPDVEWDDVRLATRLAEIKAEFKHDRNSLYKHLTHAINFGQGPKGAQEKIYKETDILQPLNKISTVMGIYKELFPEIPKWHTESRLQADRDGFLRNAFGYVLRFSHVFKWKKEGGKWVKEPGDDAQAVLAFKPQSNAAGIIKEAILRLYFDWYEEAGQWLRLQLHDEVFTEPLIELVDKVDELLKIEMERPIKQLALPASYNMGPYLTIGTEGKRGPVWGSMQ